MTYSKIVVGIDFSEGAATALEWAIELGRATGGEVILTYVMDVVDPPINFPDKQYEAFRHQELERDRSRLRGLTQTLRGQSVTISDAVIDGRPATGLIDVAEELGADLVIVGRSSHSAVTRLFLGSVAESVVRHHRASVLLARPRREGGSYRQRILVPTDFSHHADVALGTALEIAPRGGHVEVFHAWNFPAAAERFYAESDGPLADAIRAEVEKRGRELLLRYASDRAELSFGQANRSARAGILGRIEDHRPDLVVMGSHGRSGPGRWLLGSVAEAVMRRAECSVLVVKAPEAP